MILSSLIIDKITLPAKEFIGYAKEFENINFKKISKEMTNSDFIKLANAFDELQKALNDTIEKTKQKNNEILRLNENLKNELVYKRNLVASISHDIKTPLTIIAATISAIQDGIFTPDEMEVELQNVLNEIDNTKKMLQDTINIYQIESEISEEKFTEFQLIEVINNVTEDLSKLITKYKHSLHLNLSSDITLNADKDKITMAIKNLVLNAIIHSPENNNIQINIVSNKIHSVLEIINTGVNIKDYELENIFKPFYRTDKSRTKKDDFGNGLGLYITKEILNKHNLDINVENIENGVKFYIVFKH
jgi:two-component system sensor histidine kinase VanS